MFLVVVDDVDCVWFVVVGRGCGVVGRGMGYMGY